MNDPEEGKVLKEILTRNKAEKEIEEYFAETRLFTNGDYSDSNVYLGSFLPAPSGNERKDTHEDELVMWRTYGKDENMNEASGCSIVIDNEFFFWRTADSRPRIIQSFDDTLMLVNETNTDFKTPVTQTDEKIHEKEKTDFYNEEQELYRVLYYNSAEDKIENKIDFNSTQLNEDIKSLKQTLKVFIAERKAGNDKEIDTIIARGLSELRYFFKSANYSFENEYRVIQYCDPKSKLVKFDEKQKTIPRVLYVESTKALKPYIKKLYLGPKVSHPERWMYLEVALRRGSGKNDVKVVASSCKFQ